MKNRAKVRKEVKREIDVSQIKKRDSNLIPDAFLKSFFSPFAFDF